MKLYTYFRSSAAYRVRIALNYKGIPYEAVPVHLLRGGGEQRQEGYLQINPQGLVPALEHDGTIFHESLAIIEYLDELFQQKPLLPHDAIGRAQVRAMALMIACDIHPLNNLRVLRYLKHTGGQSDEAINAWSRHWVETGFEALEKKVVTYSRSGHHCFGDTVTLADVCLVPQMANARRNDVDLDRFPRLAAIDDYLRALPEFERAAPEQQPDAE